MLRAARGSREAFEELVTRHQHGLLNFFSRMGAYTEAEDLVQETFLRVFRYRRRYRPTAKFTTFLYVLGRNVWADLGRKKARRERLDASLQTEAEIARREERGEKGAVRLDVQAALNRLSPKLREVVVLNVYRGMSYQEVADALGIPLGTVKSRLNLALHELREFFDDDKTE